MESTAGGTPVEITIGPPRPELLSISAFARRVGLTPSALRFYDDCRVLRPARVDGSTGYRYYDLDQEMRARVLRSLREAGLPLPEVMVVLDGGADEARTVLERHRATVRERSRTADATIAAVLRSLPGATDTDTAPGGGSVTRIRFGGAELAAAVRQVVPAAGGDPECPALGCVLIEVGADDGEVRLVATDRYRLSIRILKPVVTVEGPSRRILLAAGPLGEIVAWVTRCPAVTVELGPAGAALHAADGSGSRELATFEGRFPDYREVLSALPPSRHRLIVDRSALLGAVHTLGGTDGGDLPGIALRLDKDEVLVSLPDRTDTTGTTDDRSPAFPLPAVCLGELPLRIGFDPAVLAPALEASVGPDVLLEIASATEPVLVRSADQGSFTTLVMPMALPPSPPQR
jgi:DNA-binding transcriptional MerR regulator